MSYPNSTIASVKAKLQAKSRRLPNGCIVWIGVRTRKGYGQLRAFQRQRWQAHRLSWFVHRGPIPEGNLVLHSCDNPPCINPEHLFLGDHAANMADRERKGRVPKGEQMRKKLTDRKVVAIKRLLGLGFSYARIAGRFGCTKENIAAINQRKIWKHIK